MDSLDLAAVDRLAALPSVRVAVASVVINCVVIVLACHVLLRLVVSTVQLLALRWSVQLYYRLVGFYRAAALRDELIEACADFDPDIVVDASDVVDYIAVPRNGDLFDFKVSSISRCDQRKQC